MSKSIHEFVSINEGRIEILEGMMKDLLQNSPQDMSTKNSEYYSGEYKVKLQELNKTSIAWGFISEGKTKQAYNNLINGGLLSEEMPLLKLTAYYATLFEVTKFGNCAGRSSYSAFKFYEIFPKDSGISIEVNKMKNYDHFVVCLKCKDSLYIYDPLTNPSLIFDIVKYHDEIYEKYLTKTTKFNMPEFKLSINEQNYIAYNDVKNIIKGDFLNVLSSEDLLNLLDFNGNQGNLRWYLDRKLLIHNAFNKILNKIGEEPFSREDDTYNFLMESNISLANRFKIYGEENSYIKNQVNNT
jgi:hypothetical protein